MSGALSHGSRHHSHIISVTVTSEDDLSAARGSRARISTSQPDTEHAQNTQLGALLLLSSCVWLLSSFWLDLRNSIKQKYQGRKQRYSYSDSYQVIYFLLLWKLIVIVLQNIRAQRISDNNN